MVKTVWWRRIPHPQYGNYGGAKRHKDPVDKMDKLFKIHDRNIEKAVTKKDREEADKKLGVGLRRDLRPYKRKIYGPVYHWFAKLIFKP